MSAPEPPFAALRRVLEEHGVAFETQDVAVDEVADVVDALALPAAFVALWARGPAPGSELPWIGEELLLFALPELLDAQEGYREEGPRGGASPAWSQDWVVLGSAAADPFFIDVTAPGPPVCFARHGEGSWNPVRVARTVEDFLACLTAVESVLVRDFHLDVLDDDGLRPGFRPAVQRALEQAVPAEDAARFLAVLD